VLVEQDDARLADAPATLRAAARTRLPTLRKVLAAHPQALEDVETALAA
jgi:hypothetical protein